MSGDFRSHPARQANLTRRASEANSEAQVLGPMAEVAAPSEANSEAQVLGPMAEMAAPSEANSEAQVLGPMAEMAAPSEANLGVDAARGD